MSVAVLCNLSDGLIIGVDSAITIFDANSIQKVFEDAEKLFQLAGKIGVATPTPSPISAPSIPVPVRSIC